MPTTFTYAGIQLGFPDSDGAIQRWCDRYRPIDDIFSYSQPSHAVEGRDRPQGQHGHAVGLPRFNWTYQPPRYRLNTLWWPCTGASRFAVGLFLTNLVNAKKIQAAIATGDGSGQLNMSDSVNSIQLSMWALPMRPLGAIATSVFPLVLVPLVDRRYWWQWSKTGQMFLGPTSTWSDLLGQITSGLGVSVDTPDAETGGYDAPDWSGFDLWHENAGMMIDAYAATVGQRFVAGIDGSYRCRKADADDSVCQSNIDDAELSAGGEFLTVAAAAPGKVTVVFPRRQGGIVYQNGVCDTVTVNGANPSAPGEVTVHTSFQADYSSRASGADNQGQLNNLAQAIARDYYAWHVKQYSGTIPGVAGSWQATGFDDYLWFHFGASADKHCGDTEECDGFFAPWLAHTLVESLSDNFGVDENLTQASAPTAPRTFRPMPIFRAQLIGEFQDRDPLPAIAPARLLYADDYPPTGNLAQDGHDVYVFDTLNKRGALSNDAKVWVSALGADSEMFELITGAGDGGGDTIVFQLFAESTATEPVLDLGGQFTALLCSLNGGTGFYEPVAPPRVIVVVDFYRTPGEWQGMVGLRGLGRKRTFQISGRDAYDIIWMERPALLTTGQLRTGVPDNFGSYGEPTPGSLYHYQQGEKAPPDVSAVWDTLGLYPRALGIGSVDSQSQDPAPGSQFIASWNDRQRELDFLVAQQQTFYCTATLMNNLLSDDALGRARDVKTQMFSPFNLAPRYSEQDGLSFRNDLNLIGVQGDQCLLMWLEDEEEWGVVAVDPSFHHGFVRVDGVTNGVLVDATFTNPDGIFVGSIFLNAPTMECVIRFQIFNLGVADKKVVVGGKWYAAKLVSFQGDDPVYEAIATDQEWEGHNASDQSKGSTPSFTLHNGDGSDSSVSMTANLRYRKYKANKKARIRNDNGTMIANQAEC